MVVPDEFRNSKLVIILGSLGLPLSILSGIPVGWAIVDKEDLSTLEAFFKSIHEHVLGAVVNTLMTDGGKTTTVDVCFRDNLRFDPDPALPVAFRTLLSWVCHVDRYVSLQTVGYCQFRKSKHAYFSSNFDC